MTQRSKDPITSTRNPAVSLAQGVREGEESRLMAAEGVRLVEEALGAGRRFVQVLASPRLQHTERGRTLHARLLDAGAPVTSCTDRVMEKASGLTTHQGVLALVERPLFEDEALVAGSEPVLVVAAGVRDPGNLGALVRTAEAAGASGLAALRGSADPFRDKAVRGSAGSIFRLPCAGAMEAGRLMELLAAKGMKLVVLDRREGEELWDADLAGSLAVVAGSEAHGVPGRLLEGPHLRVRIPMAPPVESLNVAVAAGLILYETFRRRR